MNPILLRLLALTLSLSVGIATSLFFTHHRSGDYRSGEATIRAPANVFSPGCARTNELIGKGGDVVISVPNDDEVYIGKVRVEASQIIDRIMKLFGNQAVCDRIVFIKGAPKVRFNTLVLIVRQVREADVYRIEFVLDKKKRNVLLSKPSDQL